MSAKLDCYFFFNDTATTEIYTLSLHDALPIFPYGTERSRVWPHAAASSRTRGAAARRRRLRVILPHSRDRKSTRLNSSQRQYLVCRLLLEKKNNHQANPRHLVHLPAFYATFVS